MSALDWHVALLIVFAVQGLYSFVPSAKNLMRFLKVQVLRLKSSLSAGSFVNNRRVGDSIRWVAV